MWYCQMFVVGLLQQRIKKLIVRKSRQLTQFRSIVVNRMKTPENLPTIYCLPIRRLSEHSRPNRTMLRHMHEHVILLSNDLGSLKRYSAQKAWFLSSETVKEASSPCPQAEPRIQQPEEARSLWCHQAKTNLVLHRWPRKKKTFNIAPWIKFYKHFLRWEGWLRVSFDLKYYS